MKLEANQIESTISVSRVILSKIKTTLKKNISKTSDSQFHYYPLRTNHKMKDFLLTEANIMSLSIQRP